MVLGAQGVICGQARPPDPVSCPAATALSNGALLEEERQVAGAAVATDQGWISVACLRSEMAQRRMIARPGWGMALGDPWRTGAMRAAQRAIEHGEDARLARTLFLRMAVDSSRASHGVAPSLLAEAGEMAFELVRADSVGDPTLLRACTGFAVLARDLATATYCGTRALSLGLDTTWQALRLGWLEAGWGTETAAAAFLRIAATAARDDSTLTELAEALPGGVRPSRISRDRWRTAPPYRDSVLKGAVGLSPDSPLHEFDRAVAARFLGVSPSGMGFSRCVRLVTLSSCHQSDPIPRSLRVSAQVVRGWDVERSAWVHLLALAVPLMDLPSEPGQHRITIRLRTTDGLALHQEGWTATYQGGADLPPDGALVRRELVARTQPVRTWTLDVGADAWVVNGRQRGVLDNVLATPEGGVRASSLIVGVAAQQAHWITGGDTIPLLPLGAVPRDADVQVSLQLLNDGESEPGSATIELVPFGVGRAAVPPLLAITSAQPVPAGYSLLSRHLGVQQVDPGLYSLVVTVRTERGVAVRRSALLDVR